MGILDELRNNSRYKTGPTCVWSKVIEELGDEGEKVLQALDDPDITAAGISRTLRARGFPVNNDMVGRHRRRQCGSCFKP